MNYHNYYVYITTNPGKTVLYIGVTNYLSQRLIEHYFNRGNPGTFAGKYYCFHLIYYERFVNVKDAIARETQLKGWRREKKLILIREFNPYFKELNKSVMDVWPPKFIAERDKK